MRFVKISHAIIAVAVILVAGTGSQATPISLPSPSLPSATNGTESDIPVPTLSYNGTSADGNVTIDQHGPTIPGLSHLRCIPNFYIGKALKNSERDHMIECYRKFQQAGRWIDKMTKCPETKRYFQAWGHHWDFASDCWTACKACFKESVFDNAANLRCYKYEGVTARCHVTYE